MSYGGPDKRFGTIDRLLFEGTVSPYQLYQLPMCLPTCLPPVASDSRGTVRKMLKLR
jgi:hypothetical protein